MKKLLLHNYDLFVKNAKKILLEQCNRFRQWGMKALNLQDSLKYPPVKSKKFTRA